MQFLFLSLFLGVGLFFAFSHFAVPLPYPDSSLHIYIMFSLFRTSLYFSLSLFLSFFLSHSLSHSLTLSISLFLSLSLSLFVSVYLSPFYIYLSFFFLLSFWFSLFLSASFCFSISLVVCSKPTPRDIIQSEFELKSRDYLPSRTTILEKFMNTLNLPTPCYG